MNRAANRTSTVTWIVAGALAALLIRPSSVQACAACFGKSDDAMARGMNMGILALLVVVSFVLSGFAAFAIFLARRAARFAAQAGSSESLPSPPAPAPAPLPSDGRAWQSPNEDPSLGTSPRIRPVAESPK
jgi:hypothetical protein